MWIGYCQEGLKINETDIDFFDVRNEPFCIFGLYNPSTNFHRLPDDVAKASSDAIYSHSVNSSGGRIRFATNSPYIAIRVKHKNYNNGDPHVTRLATLGVDIYVRKNSIETYYGSYYPPIDQENYYEGIKTFSGKEMREITLYMPIGKEVFEFEVGIKKGSTLKKHSDYRIKKPIVFYGSSITNGYAASRPGNTYEGFISRSLDCDYINLGFSGSAKGEIPTAQYISGLDMSAFVFDYDHNAPDCEHLLATHKRFFDVVRNANPNLPIITISRPDSDLNDDCQSRRDIVLNTYLYARRSGDKNVYFIDGYTLFPPDCRNDCTVDGCHPNDLGFYFMSKRIGEVLKNIVIVSK